MNTTPKIVYIPEKDEMRVVFCPLEGKMSLVKGRYKLWYDEEWNLCGLAITPFTEEVKEFGRILRLGSILRSMSITEEDIKEARRELLRKLEEKW